MSKGPNCRHRNLTVKCSKSMHPEGGICVHHAILFDVWIQGIDERLLEGKPMFVVMSMFTTWLSKISRKDAMLFLE